jgi:DNA-binding PadR family transcriptional regulator
MSNTDMSDTNLTALPRAALFILAALSDDDAHGYAIMQRVRERSAGAVPLRTGSLYRHLARLIEDGLVQPAAGRPADHDPRRSTYYRLTALGRARLVEERRRLAALAAALKPKRGQA